MFGFSHITRNLKTTDYDGFYRAPAILWSTIPVLETAGDLSDNNQELIPTASYSDLLTITKKSEKREDRGVAA